MDRKYHFVLLLPDISETSARLVPVRGCCSWWRCCWAQRCAAQRWRQGGRYLGEMPPKKRARAGDGPVPAMVPSFDARRIFLRDSSSAQDDEVDTGKLPHPVLDFSKVSAAARPGTEELLSVAAKAGSGGLVSLNLANVEVGDEVALALADAIRADCCALAALNVRGNWSTMEDDEVDPRAGVALAKALRPAGHSSSLTELDAGGNNLWGAPVGVAFAAAVRMPGTCSLAALDLQGCAIGDTGAVALASTLRAGSSLTSLGIGWNQLTTSGSTAVAAALQSPACRLTRLGHWRNSLGEVGGQEIAKSLASAHCCLTELDIGWNEIGPVAGLAIAEALRSPHCKLTKLVAGNNAFGSSAGLAFASVVGSPASKLEHLAIHMNGFGETAGAAFAARIPLVLGASAQPIEPSLSQVPPTTAGYVAKASSSSSDSGSRSCVLAELFLNSNGLGAAALQQIAEHLRADTVAREVQDVGYFAGGLALLNLQDNGPSQPEVEDMMRGVGTACVETLLL